MQLITLISGNSWQLIEYDDLIIGFGYFAPSEPFSDIEDFLASLEKESNIWQKDAIIVADFNCLVVYVIHMCQMRKEKS